MLNLERTKEALRAYDEADATFDAKYSAGNGVMNDEEAETLLGALTRLGEVVGKAFALDTADRNNREVAAAYGQPSFWLRNLIEENEKGNYEG